MELTAYLEDARAELTRRGYDCAYLAVYGSQNYGLALHTPAYQSDVDVKCAVFPSLEQLAAEEAVPPVTLDWRGGQIEIKDARRMIDIALRMNPAYLEVLLTPHYLAPCAAFETLRAQMPGLIAGSGAAFLRACLGQGREKRRHMCHPYPAAAEKIRQFGYDGKQAHHMYRLLLVMRAYERTGRYELEAPEAEKPLLLALKRNEVALAEAQALTERWEAEMAEICARHPGPEGKNQPATREMKRIISRAVGEAVRASVLREQQSERKS